VLTGIVAHARSGRRGYRRRDAQPLPQHEQQRFDEYGALVETANGRCLIKRPGRFRWSYTEPYLQSIITDGKTLWIYDEDLEQVTVNPINALQVGSPAELLGAGVDVEARYVIDALGGEDRYDWYRLTPKIEAPDFQRIELGFAAGEVAAMRLTDNLSQVTVLHFTSIVRDAPIEDAAFTFTPPPGIDVIQGGLP
jgi:chaperone LolA